MTKVTWNVLSSPTEFKVRRRPDTPARVRKYTYRGGPQPQRGRPPAAGIPYGGTLLDQNATCALTFILVQAWNDKQNCKFIDMIVGYYSKCNQLLSLLLICTPFDKKNKIELNIPTIFYNNRLFSQLKSLNIKK